MKNKFFLFLLLLFFFSCDEKNIKTNITSNGGIVKIENGIFMQKYEIYDFEYKDHTYVCSKVRDGISITHAGHCNCNDKEN
jgi:hypothetical protein